MISIRKSIWITLALIVPLLFFLGCAEDESPVAPSKELSVVLLAGPKGEVPFNAYVTYKWQAKGGSGNYAGYDYTLTRGGVTVEQGTNVKINTITFYDLLPGAHIFTVLVEDSKGKTAQITRDMTVTTKEAPPEVEITESPLEGGQVAENSAVTFVWAGSDPNSFFGVITGYTFQLMLDDTVEFAGTSVQTTTTTVTIDSMVPGAFTFTLTAHDNGGFTATDTVRFSCIPANVLWIDDWYTGSLNAEFLEYQERALAFEGYAWKEYDIWDHYAGYGSTMGDLDVLLNGPGSTIDVAVWDQEETWGPFELYFATNGGFTILADFVSNGGDLILIGSEINDQIVDNNPPLPGEWENVYQGIDTVGISVITADTTIERQYLDPDSLTWIDVTVITIDTTSFDPWEYWAVDYSGVDLLTGIDGYPTISVDVGKTDPNAKSAYGYYNIDATSKVIFTEPNSDATGLITGYVYDVPDPAGIVVTLGFPLYFSPTGEYVETMQKILMDELGM